MGGNKELLDKGRNDRLLEQICPTRSVRRCGNPAAPHGPGVSLTTFCSGQLRLQCQTSAKLAHLLAPPPYTPHRATPARPDAVQARLGFGELLGTDTTRQREL
jgi:hypothetical protein